MYHLLFNIGFCPSGTHQVSGHCFTHGTTLKSHPDALKYCKSLGNELANLKNNNLLTTGQDYLLKIGENISLSNISMI